MIFGTIGARYKQGCHPDDLWTSYFTSSVYVDIQRWLYGEPDVIEVRQTFKTKEEAQDWEIKVLKRMKVVKSERWLNKTDRKGPSNFGICHSEETKRKIGQANKGNNSSSFGKIWITNGQKEKMIFSYEEIPNGYSKGRYNYNKVIFRTDDYRKQISNRMKHNKHALGYKRTEKEKQAIRERMIGNKNFINAKLSLGMLGKKHSEETKQKMRQAAIAREQRKHEQ